MPCGAEDCGCELGCICPMRCSPALPLATGYIPVVHVPRCTRVIRRNTWTRSQLASSTPAYCPRYTAPTHTIAVSSSHSQSPLPTLPGNELSSRAAASLGCEATSLPQVTFLLQSPHCCRGWRSQPPTTTTTPAPTPLVPRKPTQRVCTVRICQLRS
jgi:hypothetical protein